MARDTRARTDEVEWFDEPTLETKKAAQRTLCSMTVRHDGDASVAAELMMMCGIHPSQDRELVTNPIAARIV